jgi:hypothetical protein
MPSPKLNRCANCHEPSLSIFCCLECAEERYSIILEAFESLAETTRRALGLTQKGRAA